MSCTELYLVGKDYKKKSVIEYKNSQLFSPFVWDNLMVKYIDNLYTGSFVCESMRDEKIWEKLYNAINDGSDLYDKIIFMFSFGYVFKVKNISVLRDAIEAFVVRYIINGKNRFMDILCRFSDIYRDLKKVNSVEHSYIALHPNTCDDYIQHLFYFYDEEDEENEKTDEECYHEVGLDYWDTYEFDVAHIEYENGVDVVSENTNLEEFDK